MCNFKPETVPEHTNLLLGLEFISQADRTEANVTLNQISTVQYERVTVIQQSLTKKCITLLKISRTTKPPFFCNITPELLKNGGHNMIEWLVHVLIINHVWVTEELPTDWRRGVILPFLKRKSD